MAAMMRIFNKRMPRRKHRFLWDVEQVNNFLASSNLKLKMLTLKLTVLLALTAKSYKIFKSSRSEVFCKKGILKISHNLQENTCARVSFLMGLQACRKGVKESS